MFKSLKSTVRACYLGYITQAASINFIPLLYLNFVKEYSVSLSQIAVIPGVMFIIQIAVDLLAARFIKKIGYRACTVGAHLLAAIGIGGMGFFAELFPDPYWGIMLAVFIASTGCGLIEVIISPLVQACSAYEKSASMGVLHSFYCWGQAGVVLLTTVFFAVFGIEYWKYAALFWSLIPLLNAFVFMKVPILTLEEEGRGMSIRELFGLKEFRRFIVMMICAGAAELAVAQWVSAFAESSLNISKSIGDIAGPCLFAILMGISRVVYSKYASGEKLRKYMVISSVMCIIGYLLISCQPNAVISFIGCGVCGFAVGVMWPGTYTIAAEDCKSGGTEMFAMMAFAGDIGCTLGVMTVGVMSDAFNSNLKAGILCAVIFPMIMLINSLKLFKKKSEIVSI